MLARYLCVTSKDNLQSGRSKCAPDAPKVAGVGNEAAEAKVLGSAASAGLIPIDEASTPLARAYEPHTVEAGRYNWWEQNKCFRAPDLTKDDARQTFSMVSFCTFHD